MLKTADKDILELRKTSDKESDFPALRAYLEIHRSQDFPSAWGEVLNFCNFKVIKPELIVEDAMEIVYYFCLLLVLLERCTILCTKWRSDGKSTYDPWLDMDNQKPHCDNDDRICPQTEGRLVELLLTALTRFLFALFFACNEICPPLLLCISH